MKKLFNNGRYANVTATLALFVALGGTSYAAITLPANSVSTKQIKKGAVTLNRLSSGARAALKGQTGARGPQGPQGPAGPSGASSTTGPPGSSVYAAISDNGFLGRNAHAVDSVQLGAGVYRVQFDRDISSCVYTGNLGGTPSGGGDDIAPIGTVSIARANIAGGKYLTVGTSPGSQPFYVVVTC